MNYYNPLILFAKSSILPKGNYGTLINGPAFSADVPSVLSANRYSLNFDGINDYISLQNRVSLTGAMSISLWAKSANFFNFCLLGDSSFAYPSFRIEGDTTITLKDYEATGRNWNFVSGSISNNNWHNVIISRDGPNGNTRVYVDNVESPTGSNLLNNFYFNQIARQWDGAGNYGNFNYSGKMCEVKIFTSVLSSADRTNINSGFVISVAPVLYLKMNENTGIYVNDYA